MNHVSCFLVHLNKIKTMKKTLIIFVAAVFLAACNSNAPKEEQGTTETQIYSVSELLESANELVSETVTVKGVVVHVCKHGGQKKQGDITPILVKIGLMSP